MSIPDYQTVMLPLLKCLADDKPHQKGQIVSELAKYFKLTPEERRELLASGREEVFNNRVGWARTYLIKAGLVKSVSWGVMQITDEGKQLLKQNPSKVDLDTLYKYPSFRDFKGVKDDKKEDAGSTFIDEEKTPNEILERIGKQLDSELQIELLNQLKKVSPQKFERIVVDVLVAMGYGGSYEDAAHAIGGSGDEGVDGVINEDPLGLSKVYIQAKRWKEIPINHGEIRNFIGAIDLKHADKGVFITTSYFKKEAQDATALCSKNIVLIDGQELSKIMIRHDIGVEVENTIKVRKLNTDYFSE